MPQEQPQGSRVEPNPLDASDVPSTPADKLTSGISEPICPALLTRPSDSLPGLPVEHEDALLDRLRAAEAARLGDAA